MNNLKIYVSEFDDAGPSTSYHRVVHEVVVPHLFQIIWSNYLILMLNIFIK